MEINILKYSGKYFVKFLTKTVSLLLCEHQTNGSFSDLAASVDSAAILKLCITVVMIFFLGFSSICGGANYLVQYDLTKTIPPSEHTSCGQLSWYFWHTTIQVWMTARTRVWDRKENKILIQTWK